MKKEDTVDYHIKCAWMQIARMYNQVASKHDMTQAVGYVLMILQEKKGTPATSIGPELGMEPTGLSRLLKSMENDGLICRKPDKVDGRKVNIHLTEQGKEKRKVARSVVKNFNKRVLNQIEPKDFRTFKNVLEKVLETSSDFKNMNN